VGRNRAENYYEVGRGTGGSEGGRSPSSVAQPACPLLCLFDVRFLKTPKPCVKDFSWRKMLLRYYRKPRRQHAARSSTLSKRNFNSRGCKEDLLIGRSRRVLKGRKSRPAQRTHATPCSSGSLAKVKSSRLLRGENLNRKRTRESESGVGFITCRRKKELGR